MRKTAPIAIAALLLCALCAASTAINPTTTLAAETSNNTSAASTFTTLSDGDIAPGNVSKVNTRTLLYPGFNGPMYGHFLPWFGYANHMNVGYTSDDATQVHNQVTDMMSRGFAGMIIDWYGDPNLPNNGGHTHENNASIYVMQDAETRGGDFVFAIMEDVGALNKCANTLGCDVTQEMISDLNYVNTEFESSPAYMFFNGRPVILFFGVSIYTIDWNLVRSSVNGNPIFIFRNTSAFSQLQSDGAYSWVGITSDPTNMGLGYLDNYYSTSLKNPSFYAIGSGYKGFNDTLASWGANRIVDQHCGQTWLDTLAEAAKYYSTSNQMDALQLVTWNDYEEGTEIETGIDNCVTISASLSSSTLSWSITGDESTIDHYTVFISTNSSDLMPLADVAAGTHSLALAGFGLDPGSYQLYVKAVGKPSLLNHISSAVSYSISHSGPNTLLRLLPSVAVAPASMSATTAGSSDDGSTLSSASINFGDGTTSAATPGASTPHTYLQPGQYTVTATLKDALGATSSASTVMTVQPQYVVISSPKQASTVSSPVTLTAAAHSGVSLTSMQIFVDGSASTQVSAASLSTPLTLAAGKHEILVQAQDTSGARFKSAVYVTVLSGGSANGSASSTLPVRGRAGGRGRRAPIAHRRHRRARVDTVSRLGENIKR